MVNRIWQWHFGRGIVATANDFGRQGELPTHPELLDWLATEFVARGWSIKAMHRLMMLSSTYRMSDEYDAGNAKVDAENRYLWRMNRMRLDAEELRDAVLACAGTLNPKMGGAPVIPPLAADEVNALGDISQWPVTLDPAESLRRSVYMYVKRTFRLPMLETFDVPDATLSCSAARCDQCGAASAGADEQRIRVGAGAGVCRPAEENRGRESRARGWTPAGRSRWDGRRRPRNGTKALAMLDMPEQDLAH